MLKTNILYQNVTEEELNAFADARLQEFEKAGSPYAEMSHMLCKKIDEWMEKRPTDYLEAIFRLAQSPELEILAGEDYTIYNFRKLCQVSMTERQVGLQPVITKFHSMEELVKIYQRTVFYLRRIELEFPEELCEDFYQLVEEWDFSAYYVMTILFEKRAVYARYSLGSSIVIGLAERGRKQDAEIILAALRKQAELEENERDE